MKRNRREQKEEEVVAVEPRPEKVFGDNCLHCQKPVQLDNANQGYLHIACLSFLDPEYSKTFFKKGGGLTKIIKAQEVRS